MQKIPDRFGLIDLIRRPNLVRDLLRHKEQQQNLQYVLPSGEIRRARYGKKSLDATVDLGEIVTAVSALPPPVVVVQSNPWSDLAVANGGCVTPVAVQIAEATHQAIAAETFANKMLQLYPFLGCNIISATVPLFDRLGKGLAVNHGFVDGDFTQSLGIQGDGVKYLDSLVFPNECGVITDTGGMGWIEMNIAAGVLGEPEPIGCYDIAGSNRFSIDLRDVFRGGRWGTTPGGIASEPVAAIDAHYYSQCEAANLRKFWIDGSKKAETTALVSIASDRAMHLMGCNAGPLGPRPWEGRGFAAYFTDGTMTDAEVERLHRLLLRYLVNPKITGIPVPYGGNPIGQDVYPDPDAPENAEESECEACINSILVSRVSGQPISSRVSGKLLQSLT